MTRRNSRRIRQAGTDVHNLWNLPSTEATPAHLRAQSATGPTEVDMTELRDLVERLEVAIREGHGVLKDLRTESRQARRVVPMIVSKRIKEEVTKQLAILSEETQAVMHSCVERVNKQFDEMADILLGRDKQTRKDGRKSIPELVELIADGRAQVRQEVETVPLSLRHVGIEGDILGIKPAEETNYG